MNKILSAFLVISTLSFFGCASTPQNTTQFNLKTPSDGMAGIYVFRTGKNNVGKDIWINGQCASKFGSNHYIYREVKAGTTAVVSTQGEFKNGHKKLQVQAGELYFVQQVVSSGAFRTTANLMVHRHKPTAIKELSKTKYSNFNCSKQSIKI